MAEEKLLKCEKIYLYGAGQACVDCLGYLKENNQLGKVRNVLVTSLSDNPTVVGETSVMEIVDYLFKTGDLVIVTVMGRYQEEVITLLEKNEISNYELISNFIESDR